MDDKHPAHHPHEDAMPHAKINEPDPHLFERGIQDEQGRRRSINFPHEVLPLEALDDRPVTGHRREAALGPRPPMPTPRVLEAHTGDMVNLPPHYARYKIEPMRYAVENKFNVFQFNISKYLARCELKHDDKGSEDLRKVIRCAIMYHKFLQGNPDWWTSYSPEFIAALNKELGQ